jgi:hypothetical protein
MSRDWDGIEQRRPQPGEERKQVQQQLLAWLPVITMIFLGGAGWSTLNNEQEHLQKDVQALSSVPLAISELRREVSSGMAAIKLERVEANANLRSELASIKAVSNRNAASLITIWTRLREMEDMIKSRSEG